MVARIWIIWVVEDFAAEAGDDGCAVGECLFDVFDCGVGDDFDGCFWQVVIAGDELFHFVGVEVAVGVHIFFLPSDHVEDDFVGLLFGGFGIGEVVVGLEKRGFFTAFFVEDPIGFGFEWGLANKGYFEVGLFGVLLCCFDGGLVGLVNLG